MPGPGRSTHPVTEVRGSTEIIRQKSKKVASRSYKSEHLPRQCRLIPTVLTFNCDIDCKFCLRSHGCKLLGTVCTMSLQQSFLVVPNTIMDRSVPGPLNETLFGDCSIKADAYVSSPSIVFLVAKSEEDDVVLQMWSDFRLCVQYIFLY